MTGAHRPPQGGRRPHWGAETTPGGVQTMGKLQKYVILHTIELSVKTAMFFASILRSISTPVDLSSRVRRTMSETSLQLVLFVQGYSAFLW